MPPELELLATLRAYGIRFVIIGGHAVNFHGHIRSTEDIDIIWVRSPEAELSLFAALQTLDAKYLGSAVDPATGIEREIAITAGYVQANRLMMLTTRWGFIDLFDYIPGCPHDAVEELLADAIEVKGVHFCSLSWLRKMKEAAGRAKDLDDLEQLPSAP